MMWLMQKYATGIPRAPEGGQGGAADPPAGAGAGGAAPAGAAAAAAASQPWYGDKIDATTLGLWQNKGIDAKDPIAVATKLTEFYRNAEKFIGAKPEEMVRIPQPNAAEADINAYWQRIGVPAEAKDYDLSAVKFSDGKALDQGFSDMLRAALHEGRVPKDRAAGIVTRLVKHMEASDAAKLAEKTAIIKAETEALDKNWGANKEYNKAVAGRALRDLAAASGVPADQIAAAADALSTVGGIGAAHVWEMFRIIGTKMGEAPFIGSQPGAAGQDKVMSKSQALAEIDSLKKDRGFYERLVVRKEAAARRQWDDLHKIAYAA